MSLLFLPFICLLLSIALVPLVSNQFWHKRYGWVSGFWGVLFLGLFLLERGVGEAGYLISHALLEEYIPFILLLGALYVIAGGIRLNGKLVGTPVVNTAILAIGATLASWIGTTGAAMLFIRPILRANENRKYRVHTIVFFIMLVANTGGALTPLGDPPLFLGFLQGVEFFWTTTHLLIPTILVCGILLVQFWVLDKFLWRREAHNQSQAELHPEEVKLTIEGGINFLFLLGVLTAILASTADLPKVAGIATGHIMRDVILLLMAVLSLRATPKHIRTDNRFTWFPIKEVAVIFAAIFITIIPVLEALRGGQIPIAQLLNNPASYFWLTGLLSSVLDNAPTYLVFFNAAGGDAATLMTEDAIILTAISAGAVYMGALTYIGNAPNFMVRSIAQERGIAMPSFFGYMFWASLALMPIFVILTLIWFW